MFVVDVCWILRILTKAVVCYFLGSLCFLQSSAAGREEEGAELNLTETLRFYTSQSPPRELNMKTTP